MANEEHVAQLKQGVAAWTMWRAENDRVLVDLTGSDLSGTDLSGADLVFPKPCRADLTNADLRDANLGAQT
jgi:uncharacterized protein YjbI with pentapeptide repeats